MSTGRGITLLLVLISLAVWFMRRFDIVEVRGHSMAPTLLPGDRLIVMRAAARVGDVVLAFDPRDPNREHIKRVTTVDGSSVTLHGDNPTASTDARTFGPLPAAAVEWRVVARYWPLARLARLADRHCDPSAFRQIDLTCTVGESNAGWAPELTGIRAWISSGLSVRCARSAPSVRTTHK